MNAIVLCGGLGTRLDADLEKPLFEVGGRPMIDRVLGALDGADVDHVVAATAPQAPATREHLARHADRVSNARDGESTAWDGEPRSPPIELLETPGDGYVDDLDAALASVGRPAVTVAADLPLLAAEHVDDAIRASDNGERSLTVRVPASLKRLLGASCDRSLHGLAPTGLNVVGPEPTASEADDEAPAGSTLRSYDARLAVNVNTVGDARIAEALL